MSRDREQICAAAKVYLRPFNIPSAIFPPHKVLPPIQGVFGSWCQLAMSSRSQKPSVQIFRLKRLAAM